MVWFGWGGMFLGIGFFVVLILLIIPLGRTIWWGPYRIPGSETPLDILKKRYAKGEISKDDFERMKKDIQD